MCINCGKKGRSIITTSEPSNELYLRMIRGEVVWNHQDERWEHRSIDDSPPWWTLGIDHAGKHADSPVSLPTKPPSDPESLPSHDPSGALTHDQLIRIQQINEMASRGVISDAVRDEEVNAVAGEDR